MGRLVSNVLVHWLRSSAERPLSFLPIFNPNYQHTCSGADPFLAGEASYETIIGIQALSATTKGVQACAKHYIANEQEHNRTTSSSNLDDRTMHEVYVHPFLRSVAAGVTCVMCSYSELGLSLFEWCDQITDITILHFVDLGMFVALNFSGVFKFDMHYA